MISECIKFHNLIFQEDVEKVEIMLEAIFAWGDQRMRHDIRIYHVNELFNAISQKLSEERHFPKSGGGVFATTQLETDKYTFCQSKHAYKNIEMMINVLSFKFF